MARDEQRRGAGLLGLVDCRVGAEEKLDALELAFLARDGKRRDAVTLGLVDRRASAEEQLGAHSYSQILTHRRHSHTTREKRKRPTSATETK